MGKSRVKGIVIQIGGDTVGLDKALKGTNDQIYATQSKLKDVERLLKLDPKNTVLLEQKQRLLAQAVADTESKLETLNTTNEQMKGSLKNYDAWKAAITPVQDEIDATTKKLKDLKQQQSEMKDCGEVDTDAYKLLTEEIENTSKKLRDLKNQAKAVTDQFGNPASPEQFDALQREIAETQQQLQKLNKSAGRSEEDIAAGLQRVQRELQEVDRLLQLDPSNIVLLEQKEELLTEAINKTKKSIEFMEDAYNGMLGRCMPGVSENVEEMRALERQIEAAKIELRDMEAVANESLDDIGDAAEDAETHIRSLGDAAATVKDKAAGIADTFGPISTAAAGVGAAAFATVPATEELREGLSRLDTNAAQNAVSVEAARAAWKEFAIQSGETDSAIEATSNLLQAGFTESNLQRAVMGLAGAAQRFPDTLKVESLADSLQETLATGEAAGQFSELLSRLGVNVENFNAGLATCTTEAEKQNYVLHMLSEQGLNASYVAWKVNNEEMLAGKEASLELQMSMAELAEKLLPLITSATEALTNFLNWFNDLPESAQIAMGGMLAFVAAIAPMANAVSGASTLIEMLTNDKLPGLTKVFDLLTGTVLPGVQNGFSSVFGFIINHPIVLLIGAIVGLVALIATKGDEIQTLLQKVDDFLQGVFATDWTEVFGPVLGGILNDFFEFIKGIWDSIKQIFDGIIDFIRGVFTGDWERAWNGVVGIFQGIFSGLATILKAPINAVIGLINDAIDGINWLIDGVNNIPGVDIGRIGTIPMLADGGEVLQGSAIVGEDGAELLTVLGDRTVVQPLSQTTNHITHLGGAILHIYGAPGQNVRELAEIVMEEMQGICDSEEAGL